ncbi:MAG: polar amino acid transport system substrate-binding protein [bacterium]|jgi:polar amino acid transport system substrate-binding protein
MKTICILLGFLFFSQTVFAKTLRFCVDSRSWHPFTFSEKGKAKGMHIDIVKKALSSLQYQIQIRTFPRVRCTQIYAKRGMVDGVISIAYSPVLARFLYFPPFARVKKESRYRIMQVDHMVVTYNSKKSDYEFIGDLRSIPQPIRVPRGESFIRFLKEKKFWVEVVSNDLQNVRKLLRDKRGSMITTSILAESFNQNPRFKKKLIIHTTPFTSKSYHVAFSLQSQLSREEKLKIWQEIEKWRNDYAFMLQLYSRY